MTRTGIRVGDVTGVLQTGDGFILEAVRFQFMTSPGPFMDTLRNLQHSMQKQRHGLQTWARSPSAR